MKVPVGFSGPGKKPNPTLSPPANCIVYRIETEINNGTLERKMYQPISKNKDKPKMEGEKKVGESVSSTRFFFPFLLLVTCGFYCAFWYAF
jgi:hypothetical protein